MVHRQNNIYDDLPTFYQQIPPPRGGGIIISVHVTLSYADTDYYHSPLPRIQIHEDYKCTEYGFHPHLNDKVWIGNVPTTIVSHSACRDSGHQLSYDADTVDVTRGAATYKENVNSARYMKQSVENVVLFMDIYTI